MKINFCISFIKLGKKTVSVYYFYKSKIFKPIAIYCCQLMIILETFYYFYLYLLFLLSKMLLLTIYRLINFNL